MTNLFKKEKIWELILLIIIIIYLIMGYELPEPVANFVNTLIGKLILVVGVIYMFIYLNPILAVLSLFAVFDLIRRSDRSAKYIPSEEKKSGQLNAYNQFPYTLEQEMVKKMAPIVTSGSTLTKPSYKPMLEKIYDASSLNKM